MSFKFGATCYLINDAISCIKEVLIDKFSECFSNETATQIANDIYSYIEESIEDVRNTNSNMRESAEEQIQDLEEQIEILQERIIELEQNEAGVDV